MPRRITVVTPPGVVEIDVDDWGNIIYDTNDQSTVDCECVPIVEQNYSMSHTNIMKLFGCDSNKTGCEFTNT
jgi:hypothetical protein